MSERELEAIRRELKPPFEVILPEKLTAPVVVSSPHSGRIYPSVLVEASRLDAHSLRSSEDSLVDQLLGDVPTLGVAFIAARFARAYLDVNREPFELDPQLFGAELPRFANSRSLRVSGGLGTIARIVSESQEIYRTPPTLEAALARINALYHPFHDALRGLLLTAREQFGQALLIDVHSMPSGAMSNAGSPYCDIVLGDRFGSSCEPRIVRLARQVLKSLGYEVGLNRPYAGGFITEHYGRPLEGLNSIQIEVNRSLYLDEARHAPTDQFGELKADLMTLIGELGEEMADRDSYRAAAE